MNDVRLRLDADADQADELIQVLEAGIRAYEADTMPGEGGADYARQVREAVRRQHLGIVHRGELATTPPSSYTEGDR